MWEIIDEADKTSPLASIFSTFPFILFSSVDILLTVFVELQVLLNS